MARPRGLAPGFIHFAGKPADRTGHTCCPEACKLALAKTHAYHKKAKLLSGPWHAPATQRADVSIVARKTTNCCFFLAILTLNTSSSVYVVLADWALVIVYVVAGK